MYSGVKTGRIWAYRNNISSFARSTMLAWSEKEIYLGIEDVFCGVVGSKHTIRPQAKIDSPSRGM